MHFYGKIRLKLKAKDEQHAGCLSVILFSVRLVFIPQLQNDHRRDDTADQPHDHVNHRIIRVSALRGETE